MGSAMSEQLLHGGLVVTGGARGIGRATVLACAERGAAVAVLDLDEDAAQAVAAEASGRGAPANVGIGCDVRDEDSVATAVAAAAEAIGPLRMLVTSAGIDRGGLVHELDVHRWNDVIGTNLTGTFLACKHVLTKMIEHDDGGAVVCVSSPWAEVTSPGGASAYCASKGGISAFTRSVALDYAPYRIRINAIYPGATETTLMWASVSPDRVPEEREKTARHLALGRLAEPDDIAAGIAWLLSDQASYVTGSHLAVDGGLMARAGIDT
jgi:NAD(P)-dependent dehydrogenase (short-subunit alcohol dehydrogenase family)